MNDFKLTSIYGMDENGHLLARIAYSPYEAELKTGTITQQTRAAIILPEYNQETSQILNLENTGEDLQERADILPEILPAGIRINLLSEYNDTDIIFPVQIVDQPLFYLVPADVILFDEDLSQSDEYE